MADPFWTPSTVRFYLARWWDLKAGVLPRRRLRSDQRPSRRRGPHNPPEFEAALIRTDLERALLALEAAWPQAARAVRGYYCDASVRTADHLIRLLNATMAAFDDPSRIPDGITIIRRGTEWMARWLGGDVAPG